MAYGGSNLAWQGEESEGTVDYHAEWKAFALRRNVALFLLYSWLPASFGFFWISRHRLHEPMPAAAAIVVWLGFALAAVVVGGGVSLPAMPAAVWSARASQGRYELYAGDF